MGKFYQHKNVVCLRRDTDRDGVPGAATNVVNFDDATNAATLAEFDTNCNRFAFISGVLNRDGVPVLFAGESNERVTKREIKDQIQDRLDECDAIIVDDDAIILGVDASNNVQLRTMVKTLARNQKTLARNQKRTFRILKGLL